MLSIRRELGNEPSRIGRSDQEVEEQKKNRKMTTSTSEFLPTQGATRGNRVYVRSGAVARQVKTFAKGAQQSSHHIFCPIESLACFLMPLRVVFPLLSDPNLWPRQMPTFWDVSVCVFFFAFVGLVVSPVWLVSIRSPDDSELQRAQYQPVR